MSGEDDDLAAARAASERRNMVMDLNYQRRVLLNSLRTVLQTMPTDELAAGFTRLSEYPADEDVDALLTHALGAVMLSEIRREAARRGFSQPHRDGMISQLQ
jgi:hypothetical protein